MFPFFTNLEQIPFAISGERDVLVTTCCIINRDSTFLLPALIFLQAYFKQYIINNSPPGTLRLDAKTVWINSELFVEVMEHFIRCSSSSKDSHWLQILDSHERHFSTEVIDVAKDKGVIVLTLPPHAWNKLSPWMWGYFPLQRTLSFSIEF